jgi:hypothetical protein
LNPIALWAPGALLLVMGFVLLVLEHVGLAAGLAIILIGAALETAGVVLWAKQRAKR